MEEKIDLGDKEKGLFKLNSIKIIDRPENMGPIEEMIFNMLYQASLEDSDGILTEKDFEKYLKKNEDDLDNIYDDLEDKSIAALKSGGYLEDYKHEKSFLGSRKTGTELKITEKGITLYENILGFKSYLKNYKEEGSKSPEEVKLWKDYLIYSILLNEADGFHKFVDDYYNNYYNQNYFIYHPYFFTNAHSYSKSINESYASTTGFSNAGFGGQTSVGGGGGSFGGGGGGGR